MNFRAIAAIYTTEMMRTGRTLAQSIVSPVLSTALYFVVFGAAIGSRISEIEGVNYGSFIVPGLIMLTLLTQSTMNASFGIYFPRFVGSIYELLSAPISFLEIVIGFVGTLIIIRPGFATLSEGSLLMLATAPLFAASNLMAKAIASRDSITAIVGWQSTAVTVFLFLPALYFWQWPSLGQFLLLALGGIIGTASQLCLSQSYRVADITASFRSGRVVSCRRRRSARPRSP